MPLAKMQAAAARESRSILARFPDQWAPGKPANKAGACCAEVQLLVVLPFQMCALFFVSAHQSAAAAGHTDECMLLSYVSSVGSAADTSKLDATSANVSCTHNV